MLWTCKDGNIRRIVGNSYFLNKSAFLPETYENLYPGNRNAREQVHLLPKTQQKTKFGNVDGLFYIDVKKYIDGKYKQYDDTQERIEFEKIADKLFG